MRDSLYLAWQYLRHQRLTAVVLVASITLILYLPAALQSIVRNAERHFRSRAESTPLVVGPKGSALDLVLGSIYFDRPAEQVLRMEQVSRITIQDLGQVIPLHTRYQARDSQIVGTTTDYFRQRDLKIALGEWWKIHGECVIGAGVAERLLIGIGDRIPVSTSTTFTLANAPLRLRVTGILAATETPDDEAIFVDLDTAWILEGLGHGHTSGAKHGSPEAAVFTDITPDNVGSFHFHGDPKRFPITSMVVFPNNEKAKTILRGQYFSPEETVQIVQPGEVMDRLLQRVIMVRSYMIAVIAVVSLSTSLTMALVFVLSIRLRRAEIVTMSKIGCSRFTVASLLGSQIAILLAFGCLFAAILTFFTDRYGADLVRLLLV